MREKKLSRAYSFGRTIALLVNTLVLTAGILSCDSQNGGSSANIGKLRLSLYADTTSLKKGVSSSPTKALSDELAKFQTVDDYKIDILQDEKSIKTFDRFDQMPSEIELPEGTYTLVASKGDDKPAAFEDPFFEGSTSFTVKEAMSTPLDVTCTLANARVTVEYTEEFKEAYSEYTVLLSSPFTKNKLEIGKTEVRAAYMQVAKKGSELGIAIRLKKTGETEDKTYKIPTALSIERRQNIRLIFKTDGEVSDGIGLDILLDDEMTEKTLDEGIPDFMWQQFLEPKLSPDNFIDEQSFTVKVGKFENNPTIGFTMPAGIGSLCIKQWREDQESEAWVCNLATDEGVVAAVDRKFSWLADGKANTNVKEVRKTGQLFLNNAINSLKSPDVEGETYTYHYTFYGTDATGKAHATNTLRMTVVVQSAGMPIISFDDFPEMSIIEGDGMSKEIKASLEAEGIIDETKTTLTVNNGTVDKVYHVMTDGADLYNDWNIAVETNNEATATVKFPKEFSSQLLAPQTGKQIYSYKLHLEDKNGHTYEKEKKLTVNAPVFELTPSENGGDAFARRAILRAQVSEGTHPDNLKFQWREDGKGSWINCKNKTYQTDAIIDTLKGLQAKGKQYEIRAIYNEKEKRSTAPITITTEDEIELEDGSFENWHQKKVYSNKVAWIGIDIYQWWPFLDGSSSWWSTRNALTNSQASGSTCYYTSYSGTIPVNGDKGKAAEISSLGFGEGSTYSQTTGGWTAKKRAAGMLFIGSHSATSGGGTETFNYGHPFAVRPSGFKFQYKFKSIENESFKAYMVVENRNGDSVTELGRGELIRNQNKASFVEAKVNIKYSNTALKATHMYVVFVSSTASNPALDVVTGEVGELNGNSDSRFVGNVLTVDDVELIYE